MANLLNFLQVEGLSMLHHFDVDTKLHLERKTYTENIFMDRKMSIRNSLRRVSKLYAYYSSYNSYNFTSIFSFKSRMLHNFHIETLTWQTCSEDFFVALLPRYLPSTRTSFSVMFIRNYPTKLASKFYVITQDNNCHFISVFYPFIS